MIRFPMLAITGLIAAGLAAMPVAAFAQGGTAAPQTKAAKSDAKAPHAPAKVVAKPARRS